MTQQQPQSQKKTNYLFTQHAAPFHSPKSSKTTAGSELKKRLKGPKQEKTTKPLTAITHLSVPYRHVEFFPEGLDLPPLLLLLTRVQLAVFLEAQAAFRASHRGKQTRWAEQKQKQKQNEEKMKTKQKGFFISGFPQDIFQTTSSENRKVVPQPWYTAKRFPRYFLGIMSGLPPYVL